MHLHAQSKILTSQNNILLGLSDTQNIGRNIHLSKSLGR